MKAKLLTLIERIPLHLLVIASILLGLAPFSPQPHLVEKIKWLSNGQLVKPIDIFDLVFHGLPVLLLILKLSLLRKRSAP